jgi:predicted metal-dependent hydrolase
VTERSEIQFGTTRIPFLIRRSDRRETVALAIDGGNLVVTAPARATIERLDAVVRGKAFWVTQRLRTASTAGSNPAREFVSGETYRYLGRQYRIRVVQGAPSQGVKLDRGWLVVPTAGPPKTASAPSVHDALVRWYRRHAEERLPERVAIWAKKLGIPMPSVLVRDQRRRWGSCNQAGEVRMNWRIIQAPYSLVDYVIAHELVHAVRGDDGHSLGFWAQLGRVMPDYDERRDRLRHLGAELEW